MCGIFLYFNKRGITREQLSKSKEALDRVTHRGPDGDGIQVFDIESGYTKGIQTDATPKEIQNTISINEYEDSSAQLILGHRRLSIFDLSANGHQPMSDENGNWITFNGEVYNFVELKEVLIKEGESFNSGSDTEVILKAYKNWGEDCVKRFNGMWSFIIWDNQNKKLFISNDRFGVKPMYYYSSEDELIIASEIKQFFPFRYTVDAFNKENILTFLDTGRIDFDYSTFFEKINRFPNASVASVALNGFNGQLKPEKFHTIANFKNLKISREDACDEFRRIFRDAVKVRLRSDVNWGISISGGVDSSAIAYVAHELTSQQPYKTFSSIFPGYEADESKFIDIVVNDLKLNGHYVDSFKTFDFEDLKDHIYSQDAPIPATTFFAQWNVARLASQSGVKVLLGGQGADEVFYGYHHSFYRYCRQLILQGKWVKANSIISAYSNLKGFTKERLWKIVLSEVKSSVASKFSKKDVSDLNQMWARPNTVSKSSYLDFSKFMLPYFLRSDDRTSMAFGVETRHPFMDYRLVDFGFSLPDQYKIWEGWQKWIVRKSIPKVPESISFRKDKKGFTTPHKIWFEKYHDEFTSFDHHVKDLNIDTSNYDPFRVSSLGIWLDQVKASVAI